LAQANKACRITRSFVLPSSVHMASLLLSLAAIYSLLSPECWCLHRAMDIEASGDASDNGAMRAMQTSLMEGLFAPTVSSAIDAVTSASSHDANHTETNASDDDGDKASSKDEADSNGKKNHS